MSALRYLVLDASGLIANAVMIEDPYPEQCWAGSGRYVVCAFGEPNPTPPENLELRTDDKPQTYLLVRPTATCGIGDTMNILTGEVTPAPLPAPDVVETDP